MPQCSKPHPNSPNARIFICIKELGHDGKHHTYDVNNRDYFWDDPTKSTKENDMTHADHPFKSTAADVRQASRENYNNMIPGTSKLSIASFYKPNRDIPGDRSEIERTVFYNVSPEDMERVWDNIRAILDGYPFVVEH